MLNSHAVRAIKNRRSIIFHDTMYAKDGDGKQKLRGSYKGFNLIEYENQLIAATPSERTVATITGTSESDLYALKKKIDELNFAGDSKYAKDASIPDMHQKRILIDTIKNPAKGMFLGGPSFAEAKEILMKKFGYTEQEIKNLAKDSDPRGSKVKDQIIKGFMIYKSGKPNTFTAKNESGEQYEGTMEEIKAKIDAYWAKRDEDVMKQKVKDSSKTKDKVYFVNATVEQNGQKKKLNKPMNANSDEEAKESFKKFILAQFPSTKILEMTIDAKTKDKSPQRDDDVMKQKTRDVTKIVNYKGYEIIKNDNDNKFRVFLSGFEVFVPQKSLEAAKALIDKKESKAKDSKTKDSLVPVRQNMSTKEVEYKVNGQWKLIEGKVKIAYENEQMKYDRAEGGYHYYTCEVKDSKTKDKSPRWRIKDDKMFKLKTAAKKMKDSKVKDDVMYQGQSYPVKELHRILANKGKVKEFNELSEKEQKERMGNPFALYESGDNIYAVVRRNKVN